MMYKLAVVFCWLLLHCQSAWGQGPQTTAKPSGGNQAVSPPPSFFEWLQPFRPIITVSKFPPIFELIAQRIQQQFSNYIYEDLSRPQTYDRPTYKPYVPPSTSSTPRASANGGLTTSTVTTVTTERFVIPTVSPPKLVLVEQYDITSTPLFNQSIQIEYQLRNVIKLNAATNKTTANPNTSNPELKHTVHLIMQQNILKENATSIFEEQNDHIFKDVSDLFLNDDYSDDAIVNYYLRSDRVNKPRNLIALTKISQHVYVNIINFQLKM